jgi:hypothetical protein
VTGAYRFVGAGSGPLGAVTGGLVAGGFGLRTPFVVAAVGNALCLPVVLRIANNRAIAEARQAASTGG